MPTDPQDEKATHDPAKWLVATEIAKFKGDWTGEQIDAGEAPEPFEVLRDEGNLLLIGGVSTLWEALIGNGTTTGGQALTYYNNANAVLVVGTASTAEADTQTGAEPQGGGERHEGQRADVAVHRDHHDRLSYESPGSL
jgi:hypothetical protein